MKMTALSRIHPVVPLILLIMLAAAASSPNCVRAECKDYKIVEYEDRVEAVCVGEPETEAQKKITMEEQVNLDREGHKAYVEEQKRLREKAIADRYQAEAEAAAAAELRRRSQQFSTPQPKNDADAPAPQ
jgi:hypothetical protein